MKDYKVDKLRIELEGKPREVLNQYATIGSPSQCHWNVRDFVKKNPSAKHVFGWLVFVDSFIPHSIIEDSNGLVCITIPKENQLRYGFIRDTRFDVKITQTVIDEINIKHERILTFKGDELPEGFLVWREKGA